MSQNSLKTNYHAHIDSSHSLLDLKLGELIQYKDLIWLYTKKDLVRRYKQTILGPMWILIHPIFNTLIYTFLFGGIAGMSTAGVPQILFYMAGNSIWTFFSTSVNKCSNTFLGNSGVFGKVYFPRMAIPCSYVLTASIEYAIHLCILLIFCLFYSFTGTFSISFVSWLLLPVMMLWLSMLGIGIGLIIASTTAKYRDLIYLLPFIVNRWMYATPVVYPLSSAMDKHFIIRLIMMLNPATAPIELYRYAILGVGSVPVWNIIYSICFAVTVLLVGIILFNTVERTVIDTI